MIKSRLAAGCGLLFGVLVYLSFAPQTFLLGPREASAQQEGAQRGRRATA